MSLRPRCPFALSWLALLGCVGCLSIEFATGGGGEGGEGGTPSTVGGGGAQAGGGTGGGEGGQGGSCTPACSDDQRCGDDGCGSLCNDVDVKETWSMRFGVSGLFVLAWPETQSVFVTMNHTTILRVDTCTGEEMASHDLDTTGGDRAIRGIARLGDQLLVAYNEPGVVGDEQKRATLLDARTLETLDATSFVVGPQAEQNGYWIGSAGAGEIWANLVKSGGVARVGASEAASCSVALDDAVEATRGILPLDSGGAISAWSKTGLFRLVRLAPDAVTCATVTQTGPAFSIQTEARTLATDGAKIYAPGFGTDPTPSPNCPLALRATLIRFDLDTLEEEAITLADPSACISAFLGVATSPDEDGVYVAGAQDQSDALVGGKAILAKFAKDFEPNAEPQILTQLGGASTAWNTTFDEYGVYATGLDDQDGGFVVKCTRDLRCPEAI